MTHSTRHKMRHGAHTSMKPRDPFAALAASDAYCGMQIEAARTPFGKRAVPPLYVECPNRQTFCINNGLSAHTCPVCIAARRQAFLNE